MPSTNSKRLFNAFELNHGGSDETGALALFTGRRADNGLDETSPASTHKNKKGAGKAGTNGDDDQDDDVDDVDDEKGGATSTRSWKAMEPERQRIFRCLEHDDETRVRLLLLDAFAPELNLDDSLATVLVVARELLGVQQVRFFWPLDVARRRMYLRAVRSVLLVLSYHRSVMYL